MTDLQDVVINELITFERQNLINTYIAHGTHKINTLSVDIGGVEAITSTRGGIFSSLKLGSLSGILKATAGTVSVAIAGTDYLESLSGSTTDDLTEGSTNLYDQVVALTAGTGIGVTGTYPNFTITNTQTSAAWGNITGTLSNQTDLQGELDAKVDENSAITGATKTKITYDVKGLVTAGANATTADIVDSTDKRYVTDAESTVIDNTSGTNTGDDTNSYQLLSEKAQNSGYASLDSGGKIPVGQLPSTVMEFKGTWNATTNTPTLADGTGDAGDIYLTSVAGTQNLGSGDIAFAEGDWVVYNGTIWQQSINSNAVVSVNSQTGVVSLDTGDVSSILNNRYVTDLDLTNLSNLSGSNTGDQDLSGLVPYGIDVDLGIYDLYTNGNVGIGTTNPTEKLDVTGKIALNGTQLAYMPTDYSGTLILGDGGGSLEAGAVYNTFVGILAGTNNTIGSRNTANGYASLRYNTTGIQNTANGMFSLFSNTTGNNNTANGYYSLFANTTGSYNTANGTYSLRSNTTGSFNTANGYYSLFANTTGSFNTAVGYASLYSNTTGSYNIATGREAGRYFTGNQALTNPSNSIFLGNNTKALADSGSNEIVIGYYATGIGSNSVTLGNDSITTTALKGDVGIGTTTPTEKLEVDGNLFLNGDNDKILLGTGKDASITYNGTNLLINPKEVGTGYVNIQGQTLLSDKLMFTQTDGNEFIDSLNDGYLDYGATTAHRFLADVKLTADNRKTIYGAGDDSYIEFDGSALNIKADAVTATDVIALQSDVVFVGAGSGLPYGEIYGSEVASEIAIAGTGIANKVQITSFASDGLSNLATPDHTNDHITVVKTGIYKITCSISAESAAGGGADTFGYAVYKNNGATQFANTHINRQMAGGGGDVASITLQGLVSLTAADTIEVWVWNNSSTSNIVIDDITLNIIEIGG